MLMRKRLATWAGRSEFEYEGSIAEGVRLYYGTRQMTDISKTQWQALLHHFQGRTVKCGTKQSNPPEGSVGAWLQKNVQDRTLGSYVCPLLIHEGYAKKGSVRGIIEFNKQY